MFGSLKITILVLVQQFLIRYIPPRSNFIDSQSEMEKASIANHFNYLQDLMNKGILAYAGRCVDARFGIALIKCENIQSAESIVKNDPAVKVGIFKYELHLFSTALFDFANL